jgi:hypothetical protein
MQVLLKQAAQSIDAAKIETTPENIAKASIDVAKVRAHKVCTRALRQKRSRPSCD